MLDCPGDDLVFLLKIVAFDIAVELLEGFHRGFFVPSSSMEPRRLGNESPAENHESDWSLGQLKVGQGVDKVNSPHSTRIAMR